MFSCNHIRLLGTDVHHPEMNVLDNVTHHKEFCYWGTVK